MNSSEISAGILKAVFRLLLIAGVIWLLLQVKSLIFYLAIAGVLSLMGHPVNDFLHRKFRLPKIWASSVTILLMLCIVLSLFWLFIPLIIQQSKNLSLLNVESLQSDLEYILQELGDFLNISHPIVESQIEVANYIDNLNLDLIPQVFNSLLTTVGNFTVGLFSVLFILFFLLKDSQLLKRMILVLTPDKIEQRVNSSLSKIKYLLSRYFAGLFMQVSILVILYSTILVVFGVKNAFIIAFLCALMNLIPYIGPIIGGIFITLLTMSSYIGQDFTGYILPRTLYVLIGFILTQFIDNFFSQPFIYSTSVKSHPLEIFIVILATGVLTNPIGMIVAIPVYTALKVILKEFLSENKIVSSLTKNF
ncbi:MAG: AI-2E family transporter [Flavobacteriaceae bacterium]|nr:AI-2E family transporter [Flavobacteriaceae bacterium]